MSDSYQCQFCRAPIVLEDVNVSTDIALCRACGKTMPFSAIAPMAGAEDIDLRQPPKGVRIEENAIHGRSMIYRRISPIVFLLIPFTAVWSGFSMTGIYGQQIKAGSFNWLLSLFGLPFLIGTVMLVSIILFNLFGRWRIGVDRGVLSVTKEIGFIGWTRRLACDRSARVSIQTTRWQGNGGPQHAIQIECDGKVLKFGTTIPDESKVFLAEAIRRTLTGE